MSARVTEAMVEAGARGICLSQGADPDEMAPRALICGPKNERLPMWRYFAEQAEACLAAALSTEPGEAEGWREMPAPILERVIVAGWQRRHGTTAAYWWYHEDATDDVGRPIERPDAMLWVRLTDVLPQFPAAPTSEGLPSWLG